MPGSRPEGKDWIRKRMMTDNPDTILDVGVGKGTYWDLLARDFPTAWWTGIEVWRPYIVEYSLNVKYDDLIVADFMHPSVRPKPHDVVILGDVLEHVGKQEGIFMWEKALSLAKVAVYLSLPIDHYEQGVVFGNPYEEHKSHWTYEEIVETLPSLDEGFKGRQKGCFRGIGLAA